MLEHGECSRGVAAALRALVGAATRDVFVSGLTDCAASVGTVYAFTKDAAANLREKDDTLNVTIASFLGGATLGLRSKYHNR
jgi:hypothetical protein